MTTRNLSQNISPWVKSLPVGHLQLGRDTPANGQKVFTIGRLLRAVETGALSHSSAIARSRIERTLEALSHGVSGDAGNWDRFRKARPPLRSYKAIYFASPRLRRLAPPDKGAALAKMHLSRRAINALSAGKITTIGELICRTESGLLDLPGLGLNKALEVLASLDALSDAVQTNGSVDWIKFTQLRGFRVLPSESFTPSPKEFIEQFPSLCDAAV